MKKRTLLLLSVLSLAACPMLFAREIPEVLPKPDGKAPDKSKPVKVYILAGQSNMVGMGTVNQQSRTSFKTYQKPDRKGGPGCVVSIYRGKYDPATNYDQEKPVKTVVMKVGAYPHAQFPEIDGDYTHIARGHIWIEAPGHYQFMANAGPSIVKVGGETIYHHAPGTDPVMTDVMLEVGSHPIEIIYYERGATNLTYKWTDTAGALDTLVRGQGKYPHLLGDDGKWSVRNDVYYRGLIAAVGNGPLHPEVSAKKASEATFGPELGFGHVMGYYHDEPVLLIKTSEGNRSLGWDFLPPGSQRYTIGDKTYAGYMDMKEEWTTGTTPAPAPWYAGKQYDDCFGAVQEVLANFSQEYPQFASQGYEVAGFVWWQGHKDSLRDGHAVRYEQNLVHLINQLRAFFKAPKAPFVIATIGFHGYEMDDRYKRIFDAQMAVGDSGNYPEFKGNVATIDTRPFWRSAQESPQNQDYHYNRNAETYYLVGEAMGRAMARLKDAK